MPAPGEEVGEQTIDVVAEHGANLVESAPWGLAPGPLPGPRRIKGRPGRVDAEVMDPITALTRVERRLLRVTTDRGLVPFVTLVSLLSIALSLTITGVAVAFSGMPVTDVVVALGIAVAVPGLVAPAVAVFLGRILLALGRASEELHHLARTDALTGLLNRRAFAEDAGAVLAAGGPVVVAMLDVDSFKEVNDRHGHATGDRALALLAANLSEAAGERGVVGRLGGDEFAVVAEAAEPGRDAIMARLIAARDLHAAVPGLRASIGVFHATTTVSLAEALRRADHELYGAKRARGEPLPVLS